MNEKGVKDNRIIVSVRYQTPGQQRATRLMPLGRVPMVGELIIPAPGVCAMVSRVIHYDSGPYQDEAPICAYVDTVLTDQFSEADHHQIERSPQ